MQYTATFARRSLARTFAQGLAWVALTSSAGAQAVSTPDTTVASAPQPQAAAFSAGLDALSQGRNDDAAKLFRSAFDTAHNPAALVNLGIAYTNLGRPHAAVQALEEYLRHADTLRDASTMQAVGAEISRLRKESGRIGVHLIPQHAQVELDGIAVEVPNGELLASPGRHKISAHADGYSPFAQTLDVVAGQFTLEIQLKSLAVASAAVTVPVAPTSTAAVASTGPVETGDSESGSQCALGKVCVGPVLSLFGPPNLLGGGLHARIGQYLGVGIDYQMLPTLNLNPISFGSSLVSANARVYPFAGAFFLSGGFGYQAFHGVIRDGDVAINAKTSFPALMASVGFMGRSGFILGADLGLLFPLGSMRVRVSDGGTLAQSGIPQSEMDQARAKAEDTANKALNALPLLVQVNLLRVGYMF